MKDMHVGLQLYTVRDQTAQDFKRTVQRVAEMGYAAIEFAGYGGLMSREMAALLADTGLRAAGTHIGLSTLEQNIESELNYCLDIGCPFMVMPSLPPELRSADGIRALAVRLNRAGQRCQQRGVTLVYHNHAFEFECDQLSSRYLLDILLDETDPDVLKLEFDVYWAAFAGVDPVAYLRQYAERVPLLHLKDMTADRTFTEVGDGSLDIAAICQVAQEGSTRFLLVENDKPSIPSLESARRSLENLNSMLE
ncbi:MAG TPA: sugar phosphate isomerase/epimerase [Ktedonobacteraceae bacterium]|nr:sugar phosphate isomerase/epimerase [Ktedonobacteraceae bacterium]